MKWISVVERLPKEGEEVLVMMAPALFSLARIGTNKRWDYTECCGSPGKGICEHGSHAITHWAPIQNTKICNLCDGYHLLTYRSEKVPHLITTCIYHRHPDMPEDIFIELVSRHWYDRGMINCAPPRFKKD